jgi:hypothetical protein
VGFFFSLCVAVSFWAPRGVGVGDVHERKPPAWSPLFCAGRAAVFAGWGDQVLGCGAGGSQRSCSFCRSS